MEGKEKDFWDKVDITLHPINGVLTALAVALLGNSTTSVLRQSEMRQTNERVYTELMSNREQAESGLRKEACAHPRNWAAATCNESIIC
jgi:hypothetical protein